jgi:cellulose synthase/poly-beta-1,6-N-acetylglucosamine synthase-like glycosyltransferase
MKVIAIIVAGIAAFLITSLTVGISAWGIVILGLTIIYLLQGVITVVAMLNSWVEPKRMYGVRPPKDPRAGKRATFSLIIPCRHEEKVIGDTLAAMTRIDYPKNQYEVIVSVREDDRETIDAAQSAVNKLLLESVLRKERPMRVRIVVFSDGPERKARHLNEALESAQYGYIGVFDAEDEPHPAILRKVEAVILRKGVDAVQGGVQLINVSSRWFTILNCLEYYFWFKSVLPFLARLGATPVGGNTIFVRAQILRRLGGWDEDALTEDADLGIRLSAEGYKIAMIYDEALSTLEEAPVTVGGFLRQRSRWDQGYLQVLAKRDWERLPHAKQQILTFYLLIQPFFQFINAIGSLMLPVFTIAIQVEISIAVFSVAPLYFLLLQLGIFTIGLGMLKSQYQLKFSKWTYAKLWLAYFPYQLLLGVATVRAIRKYFAGSLVWDKTSHINVHREALGVLPKAAVETNVIGG